MIGTLFSAFGAAGLLTKLITVGVLAGSLLIAYGVWHHKVYKKGWDAAIAAIAAQDSKAIADATARRSAFKACRDQGKHWDTVTGACR